jgi:hypothetical protein
MCLAIEAVWKIDSTRLIAAIARVTHDIGIAEELAQVRVLPGDTVLTGSLTLVAPGTPPPGYEGPALCGSDELAPLTLQYGDVAGLPLAVAPLRRKPPMAADKRGPAEAPWIESLPEALRNVSCLRSMHSVRRHPSESYAPNLPQSFLARLPGRPGSRAVRVAARPDRWHLRAHRRAKSWVPCLGIPPSTGTSTASPRRQALRPSRGPAVRSSTPWGRPGCSPSPIPPGIRLRASAWPGSAPLPLVTSDSFAAVYHGGGLRARHALRSPPPPGSRGRLLGETGLPWSWEYEWFKPTAR